MATISWNGTSGDWNSTAIWTGGVVPGSADTASFTGTASGTVNVNVAVSITGITSTNPNVTLTMSNTITLSGSFTWQGGTLTTNNNNITCSVFNLSGTTSRTITLGTATVTCTAGGGSRAWDARPNISNLTFSGASSTIVISNGYGMFDGSGASLTYGTVNIAVNSTGVYINGTNTFGVLNITGTSVKTNGLMLYANQTVTGTLTITGNSAINRVLVYSDTLGTPRTITVTGATVSCSNVDFRDINMVNLVGGVQTNVDVSSTSTGDCQGNNGITFTAAGVCNWKTTTGGDWSTASNWDTTVGGVDVTDRVPLPQDDVTFNCAFTGATKQVNQTMPRMGRNIDWSGATNTPAWKINNLTQQIFGSLTMIAGMTLTTGNVDFYNRSNCTLTTAGQQLYNLSIYAVGASVGCADNLTLNMSASLYVYNGDINFNGHNLAALAVSSNGYASRSFSNSGTWTISGATGTTIRTDGITSFSAPSTLYLTNTTANAAFQLATTTALAYNDIVITPHATYTVTFSYPFTFNNMSMSTAGGRIVKFAGNNSFVTTGTQFLKGTAGSPVTVTSTTTTAFTLVKNSGLNVATDYVTLSYSTFYSSGGVKAYAGAHSTNGGNTTNWGFTDPPILGNAIMFGDMF